MARLPAQNDANGRCVHCGRDNRGHEGEPCHEDCARYWESQGIPHPEFGADEADDGFSMSDPFDADRRTRFFESMGE